MTLTVISYLRYGFRHNMHNDLHFHPTCICIIRRYLVFQNFSNFIWRKLCAGNISALCVVRGAWRGTMWTGIYLFFHWENGNLGHWDWESNKNKQKTNKKWKVGMGLGFGQTVDWNQFDCKAGTTPRANFNGPIFRLAELVYFRASTNTKKITARLGSEPLFSLY